MAYQRNPQTPIKEEILAANIKLPAQVAIKKHIISNLTEALRLERTRRQRVKKLNLVGEEDVGPQLYRTS
jgi:hypothetical protein